MRKAQVSIFMILGLVLLITIILSVGILTDWFGLKPPEQIITCELPTELSALENTINQCQRRIADEGIRKILLNGGYVNPEDYGVVAIITPYGRAMSPYTGKTIPYWRYIESGVEKSAKPPLDSDSSFSIKSQLENYVDERIYDCVPWDDFSQYDLKINDHNTEVLFNEESVEIITNWNIQTATANCGEKEFFSFKTQLNAPVKKLYEAAESLVTQLKIGKSLEELTLKWIGIYATGSGNLPPLYGSVELKKNIRLYDLREAKKDLDEILLFMADSLQIMGTKNMQSLFTNVESIDNLRLLSIFNLDQELDNMNFQAIYYPDNAHFLVNNNPAIAMPKSSNIPIPILGYMMPKIVDEAFRYDLVYPVQFVFIQDGYQLNVGYEVNIKANQPDNGSNVTDYSDESYYCDYPGGSNVTIILEGAEEADIIFQCSEQICPVGKTFNGKLTATLPACSSGQLEAVIEDKFSELVSITSLAGEEQEISIRVYEPKETRILLQAHEVLPGLNGSYLLGEQTVSALADIILIRRGTPYVVTVGGDGMADLVPGAYDLVVINMTEFDPPVIIPDKVIEYDSNGVLPGGHEEVVVNGTNFTLLPTVFLNRVEDNAIIIPEVPQTLIIEAIAIPIERTINGLQLSYINEYEDLGILDAMFSYSENTTTEYVREGDEGILKLVVN